MPILAQKVLGFIMSILYYCKKVKGQMVAWLATAEYIQDEDDQILFNQKALNFMQVLLEKSSDWPEAD